MSEILHIITGPTAVGKTEFALQYAETHNAEIVSCDASLFYRGMDIGTAKPTREELSRVPHHLIDVCDVDQPFDIVAYDRKAKQIVEEIRQRGRSVVATGGSGFYMKSFLEPVIDTVEVSNVIREQVNQLESSSGLSGMLSLLREKSPDTGNLDVLNPRRVARALERCLASGKTLPELQEEFAQRPKPYPEYEKKIILLEREKEELEARVRLRAKAMIEAGLIDEVKSLLKLGILDNPSAASAIGYRETIDALRGKHATSELLELIIRSTLRLVKKQRTWFRTQFRQPVITINDF